jgi:thiamine pyrophosphate-dependent acetolactate synthase large subunit-like protein
MASSHTVAERPSVHDSERPASRSGVLRLGSRTVSDSLVRTLEALGVSHAFGLIGGAIAPFARSLSESTIPIVHFRHESGAAFAAVEAYFASGWPVLVFTTAGPGLSNALTGITAARWEGAKLIVVSAATSLPMRGRWGFQETQPFGPVGQGPFPGGPLFDCSHVVDDPAVLDNVAVALARGLTRPGGFVAHVQLPLGMQSTPHGRLPLPSVAQTALYGPDRDTVRRLANLLGTSKVMLWVGFGARHARPLVRCLAEQLQCPVVCSPRGKGIFPEDHPLFLGVTGLGGHASVDNYLAAQRPDYTLVLGSRLGEMTSLWDPNLVPNQALIHVDIDPGVFGAAYPSAKTIGIQAEIGSFARSLTAELEPRTQNSARRFRAAPPAASPIRARGPVRPDVLMAAIQSVVVERSDAVVMAEAGNSFAWASHCLRFGGDSRYRVSVGYGSMGHMGTGVVGAALATGKKAVAILGDGAMLMNSEVSTAAAWRVPAVWVVLNDMRYGMIEQGMMAIGYKPFATDIPPTDFVTMARCMGGDGVRVCNEVDLVEGLERAMAARGPFVVDVDIDPHVQAPSMKRNKSLLLQGASSRGGDE